MGSMKGTPNAKEKNRQKDQLWPNQSIWANPNLSMTELLARFISNVVWGPH